MKRYYADQMKSRNAAELLEIFKRSRNEWWKLRKKRVLLAGLGGIGSYALVMLSGAGVGKITVVDRDVVEISNLNRQFLYSRGDVGKSKVRAAERWKDNLHSDVEFVEDDVKNVELEGFDLVFDALDRWSEKMSLLKRASEKDVPYVLTSAGKGVVMVGTLNRIPTFSPKDECIVSPPEVAVAAAIGVNETINILERKNPVLLNRLLILDLNSYSLQIVEI